MQRRLTHAKSLLFIAFIAFVASCTSNKSEPLPSGTLQLIEVRVGTVALTQASATTEVPKDKPIVGDFSATLDTASVISGITLTSGSTTIPLKISFLNAFKSFSAMPLQALVNQEEYTVSIANTVKGKNGERFGGAAIDFVTVQEPLTIASLKIGSQTALPGVNVINVPLAGLVIEINFSTALDPTRVTAGNVQILGPPALSTQLTLEDSNKRLVITLQQSLAGFTRYRLYLSDQLKGATGEPFAQYVLEFYSAIDPTPKFPLISDDALLTLVQQQTFKYFWDFGHPTSGLARERNTSGNIVTTGGSGFGVMAILVGISRNFISRTDGVQRLDKIVTFLGTADRFHGAWPHWMDGTTGTVFPFSPNDDGGDLVETSFMLQGLLTVRQFLNPLDATENVLIGKINALWESVEFDWYTKGGENVLYWHWSPRVQWTMNVKVRGYNEALIMYMLAAGSPTHTISAAVYHQGWAQSGAIANGRVFYGTTLPVGFDYGGPLFFAHYSFMGLDPRNLSDTYANYWTQNVSHTLINHSHSVVNPNSKVGYSDECWGLTASDNESGYSAHSPTNDLGVISPTAALSSFPYTPVESMKALKFFYYTIGDRTWGPYGFYDAFNPGKGWYATSTIAIDQGPVIVMIENYRTGMLWDLFMTAPEVQTAMTKLGFVN